MSNTRRLRPSLLARPVRYSCAVCRLKFHSWADREAHWKYSKGARLCLDTTYLVQVRGFRYSQGAWRVTGTRPRP